MTPARLLRTSIIPLVLFAASSAHAQPLGSGNEEGTPFPRESDSAPQPPRQETPLPAAPEPAAEPFGSRGQTVLTAASGGANGAGISYESYSGSAATYFNASFEAGLDYFVVDHLSIGFDLSADYTNSTGYGADSSLVSTKSTSLEGGVRFGAELPLGETFSFYPRLTLGLVDSRQSESLVAGSALSTAGDTVASPVTSHVGPWINLFAPLLVHPTPHFFLGVGPRINHTFADTIGAPVGVSGQATRFGASFVLGGWWGGDETAIAPTEPPASRTERQRRFGDRGTFVISDATDGYALSSSYAGTKASNVSVLVEPGFDYFFANHLSIGLELWATYGKTVGFDANGNQVVDTSSGFGLAPRVGVEVPILDALSWYPRASIGFGPSSFDETSNGNQNQHTTARIFVSLDAPLLVHVARHFFVGAGPTAYRELSDTDQNGYSNQATQFGASGIVGGWL
jgi:hypothetical protein